jgi:hypothetical protein
MCVCLSLSRSLALSLSFSQSSIVKAHAELLYHVVLLSLWQSSSAGTFLEKLGDRNRKLDGYEVGVDDTDNGSAQSPWKLEILQHHDNEFNPGW